MQRFWVAHAARVPLAENSPPPESHLWNNQQRICKSSEAVRPATEAVHASGVRSSINHRLATP
jgi:hypothetical protein